MQKVLSIFSWIISIIFHPLGMPTLGCILYVLCYSVPVFHETAFFTVPQVILPVFELFYLLPLVLCLFYGVFFMKKADFDNKHHRLMLLFIIDIAYTISFFNGSIMQFFRTYLLLCIITIFIANLITYFWRISLHTIGMGGLLGLLASFYLEEPLFYTFAIELIPFFIILSGLVGTSRLYLKAHTPLQIYAGYAVGFFTIFLGMCFLKYL